MSSFVNNVESDSTTNVENLKIPDAARSVVILLGVSFAEANYLYEYSVREAKDKFWEALCAANKIDKSLFQRNKHLSEVDQMKNSVVASEEIEVLRAMYPDEKHFQITSFTVPDGDSLTELKIRLFPDDDDYGCYEIHIQYSNGSYPQKYPKVFVIGGWNSERAGLGTILHHGLIKFLSGLSVDDPMVFEVLNHAQELVRSGEENILSGNTMYGPESSLLPYLNGNGQVAGNVAQTRFQKEKDRQKNRIKQQGLVSFNPRPRTKSTFWSKKPNEIPTAKAFPNIPTTLKNARENLPAAQSREAFLRLMKDADQCDRVVLITGETGCGE